MKFSMVVPIYNVEAYLPRCIESLINQTYTDIEIILVDDGSPDNCPKICDDYAKRDARIKVIHQKNEGNGGASGARNKGLQKAVGNYVWFIDADDYIELDACEKFACYAKNGYDILIGDVFFEDELVGNQSSFLYTSIRSKKAMDGSSFLKKALKEGKLFSSVWLGPYRREFLLENKLEFYPGLSLEDFEFTPRAFLKAKSVFCTQAPCYHYVRRENSQMTQKNQRKNAEDVLRTCLWHEARFRNIQDEELRRLLSRWLLLTALGMVYSSKLYRYQMYIDKDFFKRSAYTRREKLHSSLVCFSPRLYFCMMDLNIRFKICITIKKIFRSVSTRNF